MTHHLIIQAADIETQDLKTLHELCGASGIEKIDGAGNFDHQAFRILHVAPTVLADPMTTANIQHYCEAHRLDFGFVVPDATLARFGLIAMDMDSTLITIECIDEIADHAGKKAQVAAVTEAAMRGEIDWSASLRQRTALLAGLPESVLEQVYKQRLKLSVGAEHLIDAAKRNHLKLLLVSGGFTFFTERLKARLGFDYAYSNTLEINHGILTGRVIGSLCDAAAKATHVRNTASLLGLQADQVIVIGDGANDLAMMQEAGCSIAFHAKPVVRAQASYALSQVGLDGALGLFPPTEEK